MIRLIPLLLLSATSTLVGAKCSTINWSPQDSAYTYSAKVCLNVEDDHLVTGTNNVVIAEFDALTSDHGAPLQPRVIDWMVKIDNDVAYSSQTGQPEGVHIRYSSTKVGHGEDLEIEASGTFVVTTKQGSETTIVHSEPISVIATPTAYNWMGIAGASTLDDGTYDATIHEAFAYVSTLVPQLSSPHHKVNPYNTAFDPPHLNSTTTLTIPELIEQVRSYTYLSWWLHGSPVGVTPPKLSFPNDILAFGTVYDIANNGRTVPLTPNLAIIHGCNTFSSATLDTFGMLPPGTNPLTVRNRAVAAFDVPIIISIWLNGVDIDVIDPWEVPPGDGQDRIDYILSVLPTAATNINMNVLALTRALEFPGSHASYNQPLSVAILLSNALYQVRTPLPVDYDGDGLLEPARASLKIHGDEYTRLRYVYFSEQEFQDRLLAGEPISVWFVEETPRGGLK